MFAGSFLPTKRLRPDLLGSTVIVSSTKIYLIFTKKINNYLTIKYIW